MKLIEFNQGRGPDKKPRKRRSDAGRKRTTGERAKDALKTAGATAGAGAAYTGGLVAGDQIFTGANKIASKAGRNLKAGAIKTARASGAPRLAKLMARKPNPKSLVGRGGTAAKYAAGLAIGDAAIRGVNKAIGTSVENRHKLKERAKEIRKRRNRR